MSFSGRTAEKLPSVPINGNARSHIWELRSQKWERSYIWVLMTIVPPTDINTNNEHLTINIYKLHPISDQSDHTKRSRIRRVL